MLDSTRALHRRARARLAYGSDPARELRAVFGKPATSTTLAAQGRSAQASSTLKEAVAAAQKAKDFRLLLLARLRSAEAGASVRGLESVLKEVESSGLAPLAAPALLALGPTGTPIQLDFKTQTYDLEIGHSRVVGANASATDAACETLSTCLALIEIVDSCNLRCPTCFATAVNGH